MLVDGVAADADGAISGHVLPEVLGGGEVLSGFSGNLANALHTDELGNLGVGMLAVEEVGVERLHAVEHGLMGVLLGGGQVLRVAEELVGIEQRLVHAAVFAVKEALESLVVDLGNEVGTPVGQLAEHFLSLQAAGVEIGIAQSGQHFVLAVEGYPAPVLLDAGEVALIELAP